MHSGFLFTMKKLKKVNFFNELRMKNPYECKIRSATRFKISINNEDQEFSLNHQGLLTRESPLQRKSLTIYWEDKSLA